MTPHFKFEEEDDMANALTPITSSLLCCWHLLPTSQLLWEQVYGCTSIMFPFPKVWHIFCLKLWSRINKASVSVKIIASLFACHSTLLLRIQLWICNIFENQK